MNEGDIDAGIMIQLLEGEVQRLTWELNRTRAALATARETGDITSSRIPGGERDASESDLIEIPLHGTEAQR